MITGSIPVSGTFWEMPVFLPISETKHLLMVNTLPGPARCVYWIGEWVNEQFIPDFAEPKQLDIVNHLLSPTVAIDDNGRMVAIGIMPERWSSSNQSAAGWANHFGLPRVWTLGPDSTIHQQPLPELSVLRQNHTHLENIALSPSQSDYLTGIEGDQLEIIAEIDLQSATRAGLIVRRGLNGAEETRIYYDQSDQTLKIDLSRSSLATDVEKGLFSGDFTLEGSERLRLHVFLDRSVVEVFVNNRGALAKRIYPTRAESIELDLFTEGGNALVESLDIWEMSDMVTAIDPGRDAQGGIFPMDIELLQNYPNPFNPETTIVFSIPEPAPVSLTIYDVLGRTVKTLLNREVKSAGRHELQWRGRDQKNNPVSSGIYLYRLETGNTVITRKMLLVQ